MRNACTTPVIGKLNIYSWFFSGLQTNVFALYFKRSNASWLAGRVTHMMLALRNKQMFALFALIVLSLLVLTIVVLSLAHINIWQVSNLKPDMVFPWN